MTIHEIRKKYLDFFAAHGHVVLPAASLLPENDPTTLFTGSGMQPMVPYLLGEPHPSGKRITDSQTCFRSQDIEEVGDNRHTTFFEMLGNWSLGDYFKQEQLEWLFQFLTKEVGLDPRRLYVTVFRGNDQVARDTDAVEIWKRLFDSVGVRADDVDFAERDGLRGGRIFYYDERKNWWSRSGTPDKMPAGEPGGPDSEVFWDFGEELKLHEASLFAAEPCHVNCDCGRFLEIGNSVFMQYRKVEDGFEPLPQRNVDFGGGLERITAAANDARDIFLLEAFGGMRSVVEHRSQRIYQVDAPTTHAFRVILDHLRAATFLISDGALPSNKDQGYFVRRLIRRAVRFGHRLGIDRSFCADVAACVVDEYQGSYPRLHERRLEVLSELEKEETKFRSTLEKGEKEFEKMFGVGGSISGKNAFDLYATYGFPLELTEEMVAEKGQQVDRQTFEEEFHRHQDLSRAGSAQKFAGGLADHSQESVRLHTATHLLHQALRTVLGDHVAQKGSNITPDRLRFDFSHPTKMSDEEKQKVEAIVNEQIEKDLPVHFEILDLDEAKRRGAIGLFEDKYATLGGKIKVYFVGDETLGYASREVCGGPHVDHTGELGHFKILKEEAVASGIRRIKAILEKK